MCFCEKAIYVVFPGVDALSLDNTVNKVPCLLLLCSEKKNSIFKDRNLSWQLNFTKQKALDFYEMSEFGKLGRISS